MSLCSVALFAFRLSVCLSVCLRLCLCVSMFVCVCLWW